MELIRPSGEKIRGGGELQREGMARWEVYLLRDKERTYEEIRSLQHRTRRKREVVACETEKKRTKKNNTDEAVGHYKEEEGGRGGGPVC